MIECVCINAKGKPQQIPEGKWVEFDEKYHITYVCRAMPQNVLAYSIYECPLDESCAPYEYFVSTRFGLTPENANLVLEMYKDLGESISESAMRELLKNSNLELA